MGWLQVVQPFAVFDLHARERLTLNELTRGLESLKLKNVDVQPHTTPHSQAQHFEAFFSFRSAVKPQDAAPRLTAVFRVRCRSNERCRRSLEILRRWWAACCS